MLISRTHLQHLPLFTRERPRLPRQRLLQSLKLRIHFVKTRLPLIQQLQRRRQRQRKRRVRLVGAGRLMILPPQSRQCLVQIFNLRRQRR